MIYNFEELIKQYGLGDALQFYKIRGLYQKYKDKPEQLNEEIQNLEKYLIELKESSSEKEHYKRKAISTLEITKIYNKQQRNEELTIEDLLFLYEIDAKIIGFDYNKDPRIDAIIKQRDKRKDLSIIFNCSEEIICIDELNIKDNQIFFDGSVFKCPLENIDEIKIPATAETVELNGLKSGENLKLSPNVKKICLNSLESGASLELPENVWNVELNGLKSGENLKLSTNVQKVCLNGLTNAKNLELPENVWYIELNGLTSAESLNLPAKASKVYLNGLTSGRGLILPSNVWYIELNGLISGEDLNLPENVKEVHLDGLISGKDLVLPANVEKVYLNSLTSVKDLNLPTNVKIVYLNGLTNAKNLNLPANVEAVYLNSLESLIDLKLPNKQVKVHWQNKWYNFEQVISLQAINKNRYVYNEKIPLEGPVSSPRPLKKSKGIVSSALLTLNLLLFGILSFIITLLIIK